MEDLIQHEMDCFGVHRIVHGDIEGEGALYEHPAVIFNDHGNATHIAFSAYYAMGEGVYELTKVSDTIASALSCNLFQPEGPCVHKEAS